jgi:putative nucleotidyltransferase-like protein
MALHLPPSLWPALFHSATGKSWPPAAIEDAKALALCAQQENLFPLLAENHDVPEVVRQAVEERRDAERAYTARMAVLSERLERLGRLLNDLRVDFIVLKGCAFHQQIYERPQQRPVKDIDVLVKDGELGRVATMLTSAGLTRFYPGTIASHASSHHETALGFNTVVVDLHQRFAQRHRFRIDYDGIWDRAVPFHGKTFTARRLSDADAVAYLSISAALRLLRGPIILYIDLWLLLQSNPRCLEGAAELAGQWQARRALYATLRRASLLFPELQPQFAVPMQHLLTIRERTLVDRYVVPKTFRAQSPTSRASQIWTKYWLLDNTVRRVRFVAEHGRETVQGFLAARKHAPGPANQGIKDGAA